MSIPLVSAVMLTADRQKLTERALRCFRSQTYECKQLVIVDTGVTPFMLPEWSIEILGSIRLAGLRRSHTDSIGTLRNLGAELADGELIVHWDSDDWSAPERMTQQVNQLLDTGADVVGAHTMVFFDSNTKSAYVYSNPPVDVLGTSLMYKREVLSKLPFDHINTGEDTKWLRDLRIKHPSVKIVLDSWVDGLAIALIHEGNSCTRLYHGIKEWRRAPEWDARAKEIML